MEVEPQGLMPVPARRSALRHAGMAPPHASEGLPSSRMAGLRADRRNPPKHTPLRSMGASQGYPPRIHPRSKDPYLHAEVGCDTQACLRAEALLRASVVFCVGG